MAIKANPLISVLLPVYNGEAYLAQSIRSILNQTLTDFELICINDGSTDSSLKILRQFARTDKRIRILNNAQNMGMAASLNRALPLSKGKYIARMDADDISLSTRFQKQVALLESNPKLVAVGGQEDIINDAGDVIAQKFFPTNPQTCYQVLANFMPIQPPTLMVRGDAFRSIRYNTTICKNDDINIYFKLLQFGELSNVDSIIFQYRQTASSLTHSNAKKVYFMALRNRLDAMINFGYRPNLLRLIGLITETAFISLVPSNWIITIFNFFRQTRPTTTISSSVDYLK
ncbi:MAG: glycosyltransferase [Candidatus Shapirobacteria bacterium]|jgi:glycosyltransferase involved in cell wall biosynthesis